jgi:GNAT superfamily N-acetyltransferase
MWFSPETRDLLIRPAEPEDLPGLIHLLRASWLTSFAPRLPWTAVQHFAEHDPARHYADAMWQEFTVAVGGRTLLGMGHARGDLVGALHVLPERKGTGTGTALLAVLEAQIAERADWARLEVLAFNHEARHFYERLGWTVARALTGEESGAPVDMIEMTKLVCQRRLGAGGK